MGGDDAVGAPRVVAGLREGCGAHAVNFRHRVSVCTALHLRLQNFMPHRAQLYLDSKPHTEQNFRAAVAAGGAAAAVR